MHQLLVVMENNSQAFFWFQSITHSTHSLPRSQGFSRVLPYVCVCMICVQIVSYGWRFVTSATCGHFCWLLSKNFAFLFPTCICAVYILKHRIDSVEIYIFLIFRKIPWHQGLKDEAHRGGYGGWCFQRTCSLWVSSYAQHFHWGGVAGQGRIHIIKCILHRSAEQSHN